LSNTLRFYSAKTEYEPPSSAYLIGQLEVPLSTYSFHLIGHTSLGFVHRLKVRTAMYGIIN